MVERVISLTPSSIRPSSVRQWATSAGGRKAIRYSFTSAVAVVVSEAAFVLSFGVLHLFASRGSSILATALGALPSYYMNRHWTWGKSGRSHLFKEVVPFWALALVGLAFSTWSADFASSHAALVTSNPAGRVVVVSVAYIAGFGILWIAKFAVLNKVLFADRQQGDTSAPSPAVR